MGHAFSRSHPLRGALVRRLLFFGHLVVAGATPILAGCAASVRAPPENTVARPVEPPFSLRPPRLGSPQPPDVCPAWPVLARSAATAPLSVVFANELSDELILRRVVLAYDGVNICQRTSPAGVRLDAGSVSSAGPATAGRHRLEVFVDLEGDPALGLRGYRFEMRSAHAFSMAPGAPFQVSIVIYPKDPSKPLEERPAVRYHDLAETTPNGLEVLPPP